MASDQGGLANYASPILRAAVFRRLNPGATISYTVVPIEEAFPKGHTEYEGKAAEAIRCEIIFADGSYLAAHKEIDTVDRGRPVAQTPERLAADETKALGRALRDAGIPQRLSELHDLMRWIVDLSEPNPPAAARASAPDAGDDGDDAPDAGAEDPTPEQVVAQKFARLSGADKAAVSKHARDALGVSNVMRSGEHAEALDEYLTKRAWIAQAELEPEEPDF